MKRFICALLACLFVSLSACAQLSLAWQEGEAFYPQDEQAWRFRYTYRYPIAEGDSFAAQAVNSYFQTALNEQMNLVLPMYANDPIMSGGGQQEISEDYAVTCNDDRLFSILLSHRQSLEGETQLSLRSAVFAVSGEFVGETLTLRGVCGVGESSQQLGEAVLKDVWRRIAAGIQAGDKGWRSGISMEKLAEGFYPQSQFYAAQGDEIVFYLQPGEFREDDEVVTYPYSYSELETLLGGNK